MKDRLRQGETLFAEGKIEEAEKYFLEIFNENPEEAEVLNNLGVISHAAGNFDSAEDYLLKALSVKDDHLDVLLNLADLYQSTNRWKEAAVHLKMYISIYDQDHNVFNQLATVYLEAGDTQNARSALEKSLKLKPDQDIVKESLRELEKGKVVTSYLPISGSYRGAFAEINITPNVSEQNSVFLQGMGGPPRRATTVSEPLMMQLLLLEDDHFTKVLFVTADLFGFGPEIVDNLKIIAAQWGIEPEGLIFNASHTHYAPGTISHIAKELGPFYEEYANQIVQTIGQHLQLLYNKLEECEILWGKVEAQIGASRRLKKDGKVIFALNQDGYYDKNTPFILLNMLKTGKKVLLVSHSCHPTGLGSESVISADYPGYMRNALKSKGIADGVMFLQGSAGSTKETVSVNGDVLFCENSIGARKNGEFLATQIMSGLKRELQPLNGPFFCTKRQISLPLKSLPPLSVLTQIRDDAGKDNLVREWTSNLLSQFPNGDFPDRLGMEVQLVSLGDKVSFITLPGEPVAELARDLKRLTNNPHSTFVLGYTNGLIGYLPTDAMIEEGGYETEASQYVYLLPSALDSGAQSTILSKAQECISAASAKDKSNGYGRYHLAKKEQKAFFVLSAGRCGTMTLAHLLNTANNARVWHHPQPDPINESLQAYWGNIDKRKAFWKARYPLIHKTWSKGLIHGETDLLMTPFCDLISEEIPDSKFIVLVRDPRDFVRSGMRRNYFHGHLWDFGRLRPKEDTVKFEEWKALDQFSKICWLWNETYQKINLMVNKLEEDRVLVVRFEDMISSIEKIREIYNILGLKGFDEEKIRAILSQKLNKQLSGSYIRPEDWSANLNDTLWRICGQTAEKYGYSRSYKIKTSVKTNKCTKPITIWDFKKFKHQSYPSEIDLSFFKKNKNGIPLINKQTKITSIGSCFARNIAIYLISRQYNYLVTENPFQEASAHWDQVFNTACMRQVFEYTFNDDWRPMVRWWPKGEMVQDPFRRNILYKKETCKQNFACHRRKSYEALTEAEIIILTLGLIETWRDRRDKMTYYRVPSPKIYDPNIHEFYVQNIQDCQRDLNEIHRIVKQHNPKAKIIVTVSPVPLFATFRMDVNAVTANSLSKSTLRVAAEYFIQHHENVYYFPSFEIVTQGIPNPYEKDNRHVTEDTINKVMEVFESQFMI